MDTCLQFSGGKDSLACLYLWRDKLDDTVVLWCNTGAAYSETIKLMEWVRSWVPHFHEMKTNQPANLDAHGWPADVIPAVNTHWGLASTGASGPKLQSSISCCAANIWLPMQSAVKELGVKRVVRGQRNDERRTSPIRSGHVEDGIEYVFPIQDWTRDQVIAYLKEVDAPIPSYYDTEQTSRDCWSCTAYADESAARIKNLPGPQREIVMTRMRSIRDAVNAEMRFVEAVANG